MNLSFLSISQDVLTLTIWWMSNYDLLHVVFLWSSLCEFLWHSILYMVWLLFPQLKPHGIIFGNRVLISLVLLLGNRDSLLSSRSRFIFHNFWIFEQGVLSSSYSHLPWTRVFSTFSLCKTSILPDFSVWSYGNSLFSFSIPTMAGEQFLRSRRHLILDHDDIALFVVPYTSPSSSSTAISHAILHTRADILFSNSYQSYSW